MRTGHTSGGSPWLAVVAVAGGLALAGAGTPALGANGTWTGLSNANWNNNGNWTGAAFPNGSGQVATFNGVGNGNRTITLGADITITTILFDTVNCASYAFNAGNKFILGGAGSITLNSTVLVGQTFSSPLQLGGDGRAATYNLVNDSTAATLIYGGNITGGPGGTPGTKVLAIAGAGNLALNGAISIGGASFLQLTKSGAGTLTLAGNNTYKGQTTISGGQVTLAHNNALGDLPSDTLLKGGATLALQGGITVTEAFGEIGTNPTAATIRNLSGDNILKGTLTKKGPAVFVSDAGTLTIQGNIDGTVNSITLRGAAAGEISGSITTAYSIQKNDSGIWILSGANTYTTVTAVNAGVLRLRHTSALGGTANGATIANDARLELDGGITVTGEALTLSGTGGATFYNGALNSRSGANTWAGNITLGAAGTRIGAEAGATLTVSGVIDSGGFNYGLLTGSADATATVVLSGASSYVGDTTVLYNLRLDGGANRLPASTGLILGDGSASGALDLNGCSQEVTGLTVGQTSGVYNNVVNNGSGTPAVLTVNAGAPSTFTGSVGGNLALTKAGASSLTLSGVNTYAGATTINAGTLALGAGGALDAGSSVSLAAGASFDVSSQASYTWGGSASLTANGTGTAVGTTAAELKGGTTVNLGTRPVALTFTPTGFSGDTTHPALYVSQGNLVLNGEVTFNNNSASRLGLGTYTLISLAGGTITGSPTLNPALGGPGLADGTAATLQVSGADLNLVVAIAPTTTTTLTRHAGTGASTTYGDALSFDVSVAPALATGSVTLKDGGADGTTIGSGTLAGGTCTISPAITALAAGSHANIVAIYEGDLTYGASTSDALTPAQAVGQKALTVAGATARSKLFDGTLATTISGTLSGIVDGDTVTLTGTGDFDNAGPGNGIGVTSTSTLGGASADNYTLTQPAGLTANILAAAVWTATTGDFLWNTAANWQDSIVGAGSGETADFNTLDLIADTAVNLNTPRTIGNLVFGDTATGIGTPASCTLANNSTPANTLTLAGATPTITVNAMGAGRSATISAVVAGSDGLTKAGAGTLRLSGANTFTGTTAVNDGTLIISTDAQLGAAPGAPTSGAIALGNGAKLTVLTSGTTINANRGLTLTGTGGTLEAAGANNLIYRGVVTGAGALTLALTGTGEGQFGSQTSSHAGGTTVAAGSKFVMFSSSTGSASTGDLTAGDFGTGPLILNDASIRPTTGGARTIGNAVTLQGNLTLYAPGSGTAQNLTLSGPVTIAGQTRTLANNSTAQLILSGTVDDGGNGYGLTKAGAGTLTLSSANTFSGVTTVNAGVVNIRHATALGNTAGATLVANNARLELEGGLTVTGEALTISGAGGTGFFNGALNSRSGANTWAGNITLGAAGTRIGAQAGATLTVSGIIDSGGNSYGLLTRPADATATVVLSGASTYAGDTTVLFDLRLDGGANRLPTSTRLILGSNDVSGLLELNGCSQEVAGLAVGQTSGVYNNVVNNGSGTPAALTVNTATPSSYAGAIGGNLALVKTGASSLTLSGANTYTGATTVQGGSLVLAADSALPAGGQVVLAGGTLNAGNFGHAAGTLDLDGNSAIVCGIGSSLAFADSSSLDWGAATLAVTGAFGAPGSGVSQVRFGSSASALTAGQLAAITVNGLPAEMDADGRLALSTVRGTVFLMK